MNTRRAGMIMIALAATLWGTWPLYTRAGALTGLTIGFLTLLVMSLPAPFVWPRQRPDRGALVALLAIGIADAANVVLYFSALSRGPVVIAVLTHYLAPALVALLAPPLLHEPRSRRSLIATPVVLLGLALVLGPSGDPSQWLPTALLGAGSAVFYATVVIGSRRAARAFSPLGVTSLHSVVSVIALVLVYRGEVLPASSAGVPLIIMAALINGLAAALLFNRALPLIGAQLVGLFTYLEPLTAAALGFLVLGEPFHPLAAVGALIIVTAGAWTAMEPPQRIAAGDIG